jgi:hypothetical protein
MDRAFNPDLSGNLGCRRIRVHRSRIAGSVVSAFVRLPASLYFDTASRREKKFSALRALAIKVR